MNKIQFLTNKELLKDYYPPIPIKKLIPDWYKNLNKYQVDKALANDVKYLVENNASSLPLTSKSCVPLRDYITSGYVIRLATDILISQEGINPETGQSAWLWYCANREFAEINAHDFGQLPVELNGKKNTYIKFDQFWGVKTPKGYSCLFYQPEMFFETRFKLLPAIVDTDTYNSPINFPGLITSTETSFKIEAGTPLMVVLPFKREEWKMELIHRQKPFVKPFIAVDWYKKIFHSRKSYN